MILVRLAQRLIGEIMLWEAAAQASVRSKRTHQNVASGTTLWAKLCFDFVAIVSQCNRHRRGLGTRASA